MSPADYGRALAAEHGPLSDDQAEASARALVEAQALRHHPEAS